MGAVLALGILLAVKGHPWLLILEEKKTLMSRLFGTTNSALQELQDKIQEILSAYPRFSKVLWHTKEDYENGILFSVRYVITLVLST